MIRSVLPAPLRHPRYRLVLFAYAALLALLSVVCLVTFEYVTERIVGMVGAATPVAAAAVIGVVATQIFSIPFLMRLETSVLAYALSKYLSAVVPLLWLTVGVFALLCQYDMALGFYVLIVGFVLMVLAASSHWAVGRR